MESILKWLFESELNIPMEQEEAYQYAEAGERVIDAREEVNVRIPQELREKWQMFLTSRTATTSGNGGWSSTGASTWPSASSWSSCGEG